MMLFLHLPYSPFHHQCWHGRNRESSNGLLMPKWCESQWCGNPESDRPMWRCHIKAIWGVTFHNFSLTYTSLPFGNELGKIGSKLPKVQLLSRAIIQTQVCPSFPQTHRTKQTILQNGSCNHGPLLRQLLNATHSYGEQAWDAFSNALSCWGRYYLWPIWVEQGWALPRACSVGQSTGWSAAHEAAQPKVHGPERTRTIHSVQSNAPSIEL